MKTQILCGVIVLLIGLFCCFFRGDTAYLPGNEITDSDLASVWGAVSNPGPGTGNYCSFSAGNFPSTGCTAAGNPCGNYSAGTGGLHKLCTGPTPVPNPITNKTEKCASVTVEQCKAVALLGSTGYYCATPTQTTMVGIRDQCVILSGPTEP